MNMEDLIEQYIHLYRSGEADSVESYAAQWPEWETELKEALPIAVAMEGAYITKGVHGQASPLAVPERLGEFIIQKKIGQGGMGTVYSAVQESLNRTVALKIHASPQSAREAQILAQLRHTNIVDVYGAGTINGVFFYVMELIDGSSLNQVDWELHFPGKTRNQAAVEIILQAARGLAYAHSRGVVHRDVKPSNLLLDKEGVVHISDFDLAASFAALESTPNGGTRRYMAPEQFKSVTSAEANSPKVDQYALGLTLGEMVYGKTELENLFRERQSDKSQPQKKAVSSVDRDLAAIIAKSTSQNPAARYASMNEMASDLKRWLNCEPVHARRAGIIHRLNLWRLRRPSQAALTILSGALTLFMFIAIFIGYVISLNGQQVQNQLRIKAQKNYQIASDTLDKAFELTVLAAGKDPNASPKTNVELLKQLVGYYKRLAQESGETEPGESTMPTLQTIAMIQKLINEHPDDPKYRNLLTILTLDSLEDKEPKKDENP